MWYHGMKELFSSRWRAGYDWLPGHTALNKLGRGGGGYLDSKHQNTAAQIETKYFSWDVMLFAL